VGAVGPCWQHPPGGPTIDVFKFGGDRCRTLPPSPPRGPPSTSSTSVVTAVGPCRQHPQGGHHQRRQLRWWSLSDLAVSTPQGAHHRCLQLRWWPQSDLPPASPRGPSSTSPTFEPPALTPPGGASTFLSVDGGRSRTSSSGTSWGPPSNAE
jgi:hypothetical protein